MKSLLPLIALIPFLASLPVARNYALPYAVLIVLLTAITHRATDDAKRPALGFFWTSAIPVVWTMSEVREGRQVWDFALPVSLGIAGLANVFALNRGLEKPHLPWIFAAILTWCVCYFGGSSGSADEMKPYFSVWSLSPETVKIIIICVRKAIHVIFYATLTHQFYRAWGKFGIAFAASASIALCDEWRQALMPNRFGSFWDVLLDLGGAAIWVWFRFLRGRSTSESTRSEPAPQ